MQLTGALSYVILTLCVTATCVQAENKEMELSEKKAERQISKREASVIIDNFPLESMYSRKPKVIYKRISKQRFRPSKPKYGPPRPTYGPPKKYKVRKPHKYGPPSHKKRSPKPRYGPPKPRRTKPKYGPPKKKRPHYTYFPPEPVGFGEPPIDYSQVFPPQKPTYAEPPVDSYGAPLQQSQIPSDKYPPTSPDFSNIPNHHEQQDNNFDSENQPWQNNQQDQNIDNNYAYSIKHPEFVKTTPEVFEEDTPIDYNEDLNLNSYSDVYKYGNIKHFLLDKKKKPQYISDGLHLLKRPWRAPDQNFDQQVLVGGQYAEPPARYVPKFQPSASMYFGNDDFGPPSSLAEAELIGSTTISPYVNYKNSNMAFSPQNLNDAFSIVEK